MKKVKYLFVLAVMLSSINTWSSNTWMEPSPSPNMTVSQICSAEPATKTCRELFDLFLVDLLEKKKAGGDGFDQENYIKNQIHTLETELRHLESQPTNSPTQQRRGPTVQATQSSLGSFDIFKFIQSPLSQLFTVFWDDPQELEEPAHEEIGVGNSSSLSRVELSPNGVQTLDLTDLTDLTDLNDHRRQKAMYEKIKVTLPAIYDDLPYKFQKQDDGYWNIRAYQGIADQTELDAYSVILEWLDVISLYLEFSESFTKNSPHADFTGIQNAITISQSLTKLGLTFKTFHSTEAVNRFIEAVNRFYSPLFVGNLAKKTLNKDAGKKYKPLKELEIRGIYGVNEFLEKFQYLPYYEPFENWGYRFTGVPQLDSFSIYTSAQEVQPLSELSLKILEGLLIRGLKDLTFQVEAHTERYQPGSRMLTQMYSDLSGIETGDKTLELQSLDLAMMGQEDAAVFIRYFKNKKNNLKRLGLFGLQMGNHGKELFDALTDAYSPKGELKIDTLSFTDIRAGTDKVQEEGMSKFLTALAESDQAKQLNKIDLSTFGITDKNIDDFAKAIVSGKNLCPSKGASLINNNISLEKIELLAESFKQVCSAKGIRLSFSNNHVTHKPFKTDDDAVKALIKKYKPDIEIDIY